MHRAKLPKARAGRGFEHERRANFCDVPIVHRHHLVAVHDGIEPVRDGERRRRAELGSQRVLDQRVRLQVDARRRLVGDHHPRPLEQRACHADQLALPCREIGAACLQRALEPLRVLADDVCHRALLERPPQLRFFPLIERVEVGAHGAREEDGVLRDDGEARAQRAEGQRGGVDAVDLDHAAADVGEAEKAREQRRLAAPRAAADPHFLAGADGEGRAVEHEGEVGAVAHADVDERDGASVRP
mmetsp:Transcript_37539/g.93318  ORF Transcript_37539/g.93318 Transcript_37539/m.93318 type:complete len:244 (-) Transcript_37539:735-1466(-)